MKTDGMYACAKLTECDKIIVLWYATEIFKYYKYPQFKNQFI